MIRRFAVLGAGGVGLAVMAGFAAFGQSGPAARENGRPGGSAMPRPTQAMLTACSSKARGDRCEVNDGNGKSIPGTCQSPQNRPLACAPAAGSAGAPAGPSSQGGQVFGPEGGANSGAKLESTRAYTLGVFCDFALDARNPTIDMASRASWTCANGRRELTANGVPDHAIGRFPNANNPNRVQEQSVSFAATLEPVAFSGPGLPVRIAAYALNGVKFDPATAGRCNNDVASLRDCDLARGTGQWSIEALGQQTFDFGADENNAHVQPGGEYHYHGIPTGMLAPAAVAGQSMQLVGWAADGFPVYARYGYPDGSSMLAPLRNMQSSYQMKTRPDPGRPSTAIAPMGTFTQDFEFVAGSGDLDECNGRFGVTPEFPEGIYHYYATDGFPFIQRCVKGSVETGSAMRQQRPGRGPSDRRMGVRRAR